MAKKPQINGSSVKQNLKNIKPKEFEYEYEPAEVVDIILDSNHLQYIDDNDIGVILFRRVKKDFKKNDTQLLKAAPLNKNDILYPLLHEIVFVYVAPNAINSILPQASSYYYDNTVNIWNYVNHNALPYSTQTYSANSDVSSFSGNTSSNESEILLGEYFQENINIPSLMPFEGDRILSGRYGNSIRFGATTEKDINNWSEKGTVGEPILIFRVDKKTSNTKYIIEDINNDDASIYITDGQSINFKPNSVIENSFVKNDKPQSIVDFIDSQIFLTASRININSKTDSIKLSSKKSTHVTADTSINLDAKNYIALDSSKLYFGKGAANEKEPMLLGTQTLDTFTNIIDELIIATYTTPSGPSGPMLPPSSLKLTQLNLKLKSLKYILSKKSFVE